MSLIVDYLVSSALFSSSQIIIISGFVFLLSSSFFFFFLLHLLLLSSSSSSSFFFFFLFFFFLLILLLLLLPFFFNLFFFFFLLLLLRFLNYLAGIYYIRETCISVYIVSSHFTFVYFQSSVHFSLVQLCCVGSCTRVVFLFLNVRSSPFVCSLLPRPPPGLPFFRNGQGRR